jgi:hypothetical protein
MTYCTLAVDSPEHKRQILYRDHVFRPTSAAACASTLNRTQQQNSSELKRVYKPARSARACS